MRELLLILPLVALTHTSQEVPIVSGKEAAAHAGKRATVCGPVASTRYNPDADERPTFLNLDQPFPKQSFSFVILGKDRAAFGTPEERYKDKTICGTGMVERLPTGIVRMVLSSPSQVTEKQGARVARPRSD